MESVSFAATWLKTPIRYKWTGLDDNYVYRFQDIAWRFLTARDLSLWCLGYYESF